MTAAPGPNLRPSRDAPTNLYACRYGRDVDFMKVLDFGQEWTRAKARE